MQHEIKLFPGARLRSMKEEDCAVAAGLDAECPVEGQAPCSASVFRSRLGASGYYQFLVELGSSAVGVVAIKIDVDKEELDFLKICLNDSGRGLGHKVILAIKEFGRQNGATHIVGRCPPKLFKFYEEVGAYKTGEIPHFFGIGKPAIALRAEL